MKTTIPLWKNSIFAGYFFLWAVLSLIIPVSGFANDFHNNNFVSKTSKARLAVEEAWETYHHGALGGTLASPAVQTELEMNLHQSRALLSEAYDAEERGDMKATDQLINQIMEITNNVITESQEQKK